MNSKPWMNSKISRIGWLFAPLVFYVCFDDTKRTVAQEQDLPKDTINTLRVVPPAAPPIVPLPVYQVSSSLEPQAPVPDASPIQWNASGRVLEIPAGLPTAIVADPSTIQHSFPESNFMTTPIDSFQEVSIPIPLAVTDFEGTPSTAVAISISARQGFTLASSDSKSSPTTSKILFFQPGHTEPALAFESNQSLRMLDHHQPSGRTLVIEGRSTRRTIGDLVVLEGWNDKSLKVVRRLKLDVEGKMGMPAQLHHGYLIDPQHVLLVIDRSIGLWNLETARCVYRIDGIDTRTKIAVSGGRRYVAIPFNGGVDLWYTDTGKPIGRILVESQVPGVSFSTDGTRLAIANSRRLRVWDLTAAALSADVSSLRSLGSGRPLWIDSDYVMTGSGTLVSLFRTIPLWRYDLGSDRVTEVGNHIAVFRKHPQGELSVLRLPHETAQTQISKIDSGEIKVDRETWRIADQSRWRGQWVD
jgi:hypothetical protein